MVMMKPEPTCVDYTEALICGRPLQGLKAFERNGKIVSASLRQSIFEDGDDEARTRPQQSNKVLHTQTCPGPDRGDATGSSGTRGRAVQHFAERRRGERRTREERTQQKDASSEWLGLDEERISKRAPELIDNNKAAIRGDPALGSCTVNFWVVDEYGNAELRQGIHDRSHPQRMRLHTTKLRDGVLT
mmetsp:Transcript_27826/g.59135  ORF Transcript_27826/g.59135 Transcript_27826/m.59135 type:complete len:188 (-) Transcript_27826:165-728(-)